MSITSPEDTKIAEVVTAVVVDSTHRILYALASRISVQVVYNNLQLFSLAQNLEINEHVIEILWLFRFSDEPCVFLEVLQSNLIIYLYLAIQFTIPHDIFKEPQHFKSIC